MPKKASKKKSRINPSRKGGAWERMASVSLSLWISKSCGDCRDDLIWRSAGSGSRATAASKKGGLRSAQAGDLVANDARAQELLSKFLVECKAYRNLKLEGLVFRASNPTLSICIDKPIEQAREHNKWPLLVLKQNNRTPLLIMPRFLAQIVSKHLGLVPSVTFARDTANGDVEFFSVFSMPDFLEHVDYARFISAMPKRGDIVQGPVYF